LIHFYKRYRQPAASPSPGPGGWQELVVRGIRTISAFILMLNR